MPLVSDTIRYPTPPAFNVQFGSVRFSTPDPLVVAPTPLDDGAPRLPGVGWSKNAQVKPDRFAAGAPADCSGTEIERVADGARAAIVTVAVPIFVPSCVLVAVIVIVCALDVATGAEK